MNNHLLKVVSMQLLHYLWCHPKEHNIEMWNNHITKSKKQRARNETYQQGVPTKVFLERCLSPVSNMHADTPKSANFMEPLLSTNIFPAWNKLIKIINWQLNSAIEI